jgi:uncharacterized membrane protein
MPNRRRALAEYVHGGGGLAMAGGYYSFGGIYGAAHYHRTSVEEVLPVEIAPHDDRVEVPEGFSPKVVNTIAPHCLWNRRTLAYTARLQRTTGEKRCRGAR